MSDMSPDMQDEARIAEELVLMEWQRDTDQIEILEENLQQALKDRQSDQSWIQDLESQLGQKNIKIEECGATLRNMDLIEHSPQEIQDLRKSQQELQRRVSEIFTCAEKKEAELETFKSEYVRSHFDESNERQRLELKLEKVQANATDMHDSENGRTQIWSRDTSEQEAPANHVRLGQEIQPDDGLRLRTGNSALWNQIPNMGGNTYVEMPVFQKVILNGISVLATSTTRAKSSYQGDPPEELRPLSMSNATGSNLKLAYVHICRVQNDEVFSNGLSSVSNQHFQVYRLCCDRQLALILVRRGKIKLEELCPGNNCFWVITAGTIQAERRQTSAMPIQKQDPPPDWHLDPGRKLGPKSHSGNERPLGNHLAGLGSVRYITIHLGSPWSDLSMDHYYDTSASSCLRDTASPPCPPLDAPNGKRKSSAVVRDDVQDTRSKANSSI
ncbi:hypothetical protein B0H14DRAFT_3130823 [Mycena olivaceomarginata]|nr:hypothetical protein B0H14DRAFT_3130823 [Mycena olivaceomarginata]